MRRRFCLQRKSICFLFLENANVFRLFHQHPPDPVLHIQQGKCFHLRHAGDDTSTLTTLSSLSSGAVFSGQNMTQINFSAKDASGNTWTAPNGITGEYTLNNFDLYTEVLTEEQMTAYALSSVPEPAAASLGLLGLGILLMRRRRA